MRLKEWGAGWGNQEFQPCPWGCQQALTSCLICSFPSLFWALDCGRPCLWPLDSLSSCISSLGVLPCCHPVPCTTISCPLLGPAIPTLCAARAAMNPQTLGQQGNNTTTTATILIFQMHGSSKCSFSLCTHGWKRWAQKFMRKHRLEMCWS